MVSSSGDALNQKNSWYEKVKFGLLTLSFSFVVASYTIAKELKDSIFISIVGEEYLAKAKLFVIFFLIPAVFLYSYLVDKYRRYQLLSFYCVFYGISLLLCALLLGNSHIGLYNTDTSPWRLFGWVFYFLIEGFSPFVVGVFWAFASSIASPDEAKNYYGLMVAGSKIGGMLGAAASWYLLSHLLLLLPGFDLASGDVVAHQLLLVLVALLLLVVPMLIQVLMTFVPGRLLHGYEAVYKAEKAQARRGEQVTGIISGLKSLIQSPYLFGIFGLVFFYESLNVILNLQRLHLLKADATDLAGQLDRAAFTASLFQQRFWMHAFGLVLSLIGANIIMKRLGEKASLLAVPAFISILLIYFLIMHDSTSLLQVFIGLGAVNYALSSPLRESLYIPTLKDVKFKAKSWVDTFGTKISKASGSVFSDIAWNVLPGTGMFFLVYGSFFSLLIGAWFLTSYFLGKKYEMAVSKNEIIQ
jgi:AAA family ATP:ADP antiporter